MIVCGKSSRRRHVLFLLSLSSILSSCSSFGVIDLRNKETVRNLMSTMKEEVPDTVNGGSKNTSAGDDDLELFDGMSLPSIEEENGMSLAPPLTYDKFLTMQSKRVPASIRFSADSGLKPYYLTVAKKIKDAYPDVVLDKIVLPKVQMNDSGSSNNNDLTFEVIVDGKVVVRTDRKGHYDNMHVFVSMQEIDAAVMRARKKRRPQTVYGEEESSARLQVLKNKADERKDTL